MARTQKSQRQPMLCVMTPPTMGPMAGPRRGMKVASAKEVPRWSGFQQSLRTGKEIYPSSGLELGV